MKTDTVNILYKELSEFLEIEEIKKLIEIPPNEEMGDFALPCFVLAKKLRKNPKLIAEDLVSKLSDNEYFTKVEAVSGYLNLFVNRKILTEKVLTESLKEGYGKGNEKSVTVVEYCSPNTNKPLHLGHLRNMAIGESVSRILQYAGHDVKKTCIFNDRGVHICKSMLSYRDFGKGSSPESENIKSDHFVGDYYVKFADRSKVDPDYEKKALQMLEEWEAGKKDVTELWEKMNNWAFRGFAETFELFGTEFDKEYYESKIFRKGKEIILDGLKRGIFKKREDGAVIADLEEFGLGEKVLLRSNGTSVYIVQDIFLAYLKYLDFNYDKSVYVVGNEQEYHFKVLKKILQINGNKYADGIEHLSYGMVELPEGKMKSREGTVVDADDLIKSTADLAAEEIIKRNPESEENEVKKRSLIIALAALKYQLLKTETTKNMMFNPKEAIRFEGDTGPYLLYGYARASSILRKTDIPLDARGWEANSDEIRLIKKISRFREVQKNTADRLMPSMTAAYAFELCQIFNRFFHECPVLRSENPGQRLALVAAFRNTMGTVLDLLGIEKLEEM
ncbi:MAG: arginine--tRNA ligase [Candidatus Cloacimonadota bacterium]|nr:MAG: arginine--tRNA ligase [Candidatus Cloacimonadota bacterium]